jgi:acetyl-CoA carboxylase biotin carboxyl carrier protein
VELGFNELRDLVAALSDSDVAELTLKSADFELVLRKQGMAPLAEPVVVATPGTTAVAPPSTVPVAPAAPAAPTAAEAAAPATPAVPPSQASDLVAVTSPMVGTFYRSPAPGEPPFTSPGERIRQGQTVCIIEAMKLMNELEAEVSGEVVEILVENAEPVEFGQTLMLVRPA